MHPILFHLGHLAIPTEGVLVALGLLAGLQAACLLASPRGLDPDRIWNLGLSSLLTLFLGERMLVIAFNLRDFIDHPLWMLGLVLIRDERYFYGGVLLALCTSAAYIEAWRLPRRTVLDVLAPGAGLALACISLGSFAASADLGRPTAAGAVITQTSRLAARASGTPLATALAAAVLQLVFAGVAAWLALHSRRAGSAAAFWLFAAGLSTVLLGQLHSRLAAETLVLQTFTPAQMLGVLAVGFSLVLYLAVEFDATE